MGTTQPIRETESLGKFIDYYETAEPSPRNRALIVLGLHTALRISDILALRWGDVYDFDSGSYRSHVYLREKKTKKSNVVALHPRAAAALEELRRGREGCGAGDFVFTGAKSGDAPLSRSQAYRIVRRAAKNALNDDHVSCHTLRKTFGYHAWKQGTPPALLMEIYNHSSYQVTKRYLGIEQDERDSVYLAMDF